MVVPRYFDQRERFSDDPEIFVYDDLPAEFRVKVSLAIADMWEVNGEQSPRSRSEPVEDWQRRMLRTLGVRSLPHRNPADFFDACNVSQFFIAIEVALESSEDFADRLRGYAEQQLSYAALRTTFAALNTYMNYHAVGYQVEYSKKAVPPFRVFRRDTEYTHKELVQPTLRLLNANEFSHIDEQYRAAHHEYLAKNYSDAITDVASAVESLLKVMLKVTEGTLSELLDEAGKQGYFPTYLQGVVAQWKTLLLATGNVRNKLGDAHGRDGNKLDEWELERYARLALNLGATFMLFLSDEYRGRQK